MNQIRPPSRPTTPIGTVASPALVIDDNPLACAVVSRILARLGVAEVTTAANGLEAQDLLQRGKRFALTICDIRMPGMNGVEFIRALDDPSACGRLLIVSSTESRIQLGFEKLARAYGLDVLGRVEKPVTIDIMRRVLETLPRSADVTSPKRSDPGIDPDTWSPEEIGESIVSGAIVPFYQPLIHIGSGTIGAVEALARWQHPDHGLLSPIAFLDSIEKHGQMPGLSRQFVKRGTRDLASWQPLSAPLALAVNLSASLLSDPDLPDILESCVNESGLKCPQVTLEITEKTAPPDWTCALDSLLRLRLKGFRLSLDDFGTGYAALHSLKDAPFDEIKIDRSFVTGASESKEGTTLLAACVAMAKGLNAQIVAEGVECWSDYDLVRRLGFDIAQGYFISRPLSASEMGVFAENWDPARLDDRRLARQL